MIIEVSALILTALLFGGMTFFSFGFAPVLFAQLPMDRVRPLLRGTFPYYYLAVILLGATATGVTLAVDVTAGALIGVITASTVYARQILMPQINAATDRDDKRAFGRLHGLSVVIQLVQIGLAGWAVVLLAG
ncbi:MAG: DUF4149 domain-containing protein [Pseudomonadota bacterium]